MYRYSDRLPWTVATNLYSNVLLELRRQGRPLLDLTVSNPTDAAFDKYPHAGISAALAKIDDFRYQPDPFGSLEARHAIGAMSGVPAAQIALTASTSEAYGLLFKLLANPGDEVLVPSPSYPLFEYLAQLEGVKIRPYRLIYDGSWYIDFDSLKGALSNRTRAIVLVNPNNPTGSYLKWPEFDRLRDIALAHSLPLISDEVFMDYAFGESASRVLTLAGQDDVLSFSLNGLSKSAGMPQMKLGWITVNGPHAERQLACERLELVLDTYLPVGAVVQHAAASLLAIGDGMRREIRLRIQANLLALDRLLHQGRVHMLHGEGGWSAILRVPNVLSENDWTIRLLREHDVIVQPGYFFDLAAEAFLVVSLITPEDAFVAGVERLLLLAQSL